MDKQSFIRRKAIERKIKWSAHALKELAAEPLSVMDVEVAIREAEIIEDYLIFIASCRIAWRWLSTIPASQSIVLWP